MFGNKFGWERANWFADAPGVEAGHDFDRSRTNAHERIRREHLAVRDGVALIDQSSFAKLEVSGRGALAAMQRLAANDLDREPGAVIYTQLCNERGGIECDLTIMRLDAERFYVVTGSGFGVHDFHWIRSHLPPDARLEAREVTGAVAVINIVGPRSRTVLARCTDDDVDGVALPFARFADIHLGAAPVRAARIGYVGELGYELHLPVEHALHVYRMLREAGAADGIVDCGYAAIDSLRLEKGYRYWSAELGPDYTPYEAGIGYCVRPGKGDFIGRAAPARQQEQGVSRTLCTFTVDAPPVFYGAECILADGRALATTTSANYGFTLRTNIAMGYLAVEDVAGSDYRIEAFGQEWPATCHDGVLYDPEMKRLKA